MKRPSRRDIIEWVAVAVILALVIVDSPRADVGPVWVGQLVIPGLLFFVVGIASARRSRKSWPRSLSATFIQLLGFLIAVGAFTALSVRFGKPRSIDPDAITSLDLLGWLLLAILMVVVVVQLARLLDLGPFGPRPVGRRT